MRATFLSVTILAATLVSGGVSYGEDLLAPGVSTLPQAPVGHLQPRANNFTPQSNANDEMQARMANYDAEQARLDRELDSKLNICRRC